MNQLRHFIKRDSLSKNYKIKSDKCNHSYKEECEHCIEFNTTPQKFFQDVVNKKI